MDFNEIITFEGGINTDDTPQSMPKGDYRDFSYCRLGYNTGNAFAVETSDGTIEINNPTITANDRILGATQWLKENAIVYFLYKDTQVHEIWIYYIETQTHQVVVQDVVLNFSPDWPIFHANVIDDILKWTDGRWDPAFYDVDGTRLFNPPYQINLRKALDGFYTVIDLQVIDAIKWPLDPPVVAYFTDPTRGDNKLRGKLFKFIIQPIYENGEIGVWSMYSNLTLPVQSELVSGTNWVFSNTDNGISITFNTGPKVIRKFNIALQQFDRESGGAEPPFGVFLQLDKDQDVIADNVSHTVSYYGGVAASPAFDVLKNYDRLPITADCQEFLPTNQIAYSNFREGYNKPTDAPFILDVSMQYQLQEIIWQPDVIEMGVEVSGVIGFNTIALFPFAFGASPTVYMTGAIYFFSLNFTSPGTATIGFKVIGGNPIDVSQQVADQINNYFGSTIAAVNPTNYTVISVGTGFIAELFQAYINPDPQTLAVPSLKTGATHEFGIVYGDRAYRDGTVYTDNSMNLFVPWYSNMDTTSFADPKNPFLVNAAIEINHVPPVWADRYWIVARPAAEILSFGQYVTNVDEDNTSNAGYISSISIDNVTNNRYRIEIDNYYESKNTGAAIFHPIQRGDKLRFIRQNAVSYNYITPYLELDILDVNKTGVGGRTVVFTNLFDLSIIQPPQPPFDFEGEVWGQHFEIYTPRPTIDDTGNLFASVWKDVTEALPIQNAHTEDRSHTVPPLVIDNFVPFQSYVSGPGLPGPTSFIAGGNFMGQVEGIVYNIEVQLLGTTPPPPPYMITGMITLTNYNPGTNETAIVVPAAPFGQPLTLTFLSKVSTFITQDQVVTDLLSTQPAIFAIAYGDVYVRRRIYGTGLDLTNNLNFGFFEDPNYSDYWNSDVHNTGRFRIEDQNAKTVHRRASSIHSDSFVLDTQINGLSSFGLDNQNIEDMNPLYGEIVRTYMSGREGKTLKCLQPRKENSIYIQYYPNEVGSDSTVRVSNKTFASWFDYKGVFGCSNAGATAALPNGATMYFDNNSGVFIYSGGNGQMVVSEIDPDTNRDYKFRTKTKQLAKAYNDSPNPIVRTYVNEIFGEVGFAFKLQNFELIGTEINPDEIIYDEEDFISSDGSQYQFGDLIEIVDIASGNLLYTGNVTGIIANIIKVGPDPIFYTIAADTAIIKRSRYVYYNDHVVFDYVNMRWRSTYDYNFAQFCNFGQTLVGWGENNQLYIHNQDREWTFHGDSFIQKVKFVSNDSPLLLKRYQDITLISDDKFSIEASSEPNRSYPLGMKTAMTENLLGMYEGYGKTNYRKNLYDPKFWVDANISTTNSNTWTLNGNQTSLNGEMITIIQDDKNIYTGIINNPVYSSVSNTTEIELVNLEPNTYGVEGKWYLSEKVLLNGEDIRANALTHTLSYDPSPGGIPGEGSVLFSVGIKGVLS